MKRRGFLKLLGIAPVAAAVAVAVEPSGISGELPPTEFADPNVDDKPILFDCEVEERMSFRRETGKLVAEFEDIRDIKLYEQIRRVWYE